MIRRSQCSCVLNCIRTHSVSFFTNIYPSKMEEIKYCLIVMFFLIIIRVTRMGLYDIYLWSSYGAKHSTTTSRWELVSAIHETFLEAGVAPFCSLILIVGVLFTFSWSLSPCSLKYRNTNELSPDLKWMNRGIFPTINGCQI